MNVSIKFVSAALVLLMTVMLSGCGGFSEGDDIFIDFGEGVNTLEGYATGTVVAIDDDIAIIKFDAVNAKTEKIPMTTLIAKIGPVPISLLSEYKPGFKSFEIRKLIERTMISLLDEHDINKVSEQTQQLIELLDNHDFPEREKLQPLFEMAHDYYKKIQLEALSDKRLQLHSELLDEINDFVREDDDIAGSFINYMGRFDKLTGAQFDLQVRVESRRFGGTAESVLAALQKFVGYPALFSGKYVQLYNEYRESLKLNASQDKEAAVRIYKALNETERRYYQVAGQYSTPSSAFRISENDWVVNKRREMAAAIIKDDIKKIAKDARSAKYASIVEAEKAFLETKSLLASKISALGIALTGDILTEKEKETFFVGPTKKRLANEAARQVRKKKKDAAKRARLKKQDAKAEKQIAWYERKLIKYRKHHGGARFFSSYSFELNIDNYDRNKREFTGTIRYKTHNGYFAGKNRVKGWFEKKGATARLIIKETSSIKKRQKQPIEPVNTYGFRLNHHASSRLDGERQVNGHRQGWAKLYIRK